MFKITRTALFINADEVLAIDSISIGADGVDLGFYTSCETCDGEGFAHGRRCAWCIDHHTHGYVTPKEATIHPAEMLALKTWIQAQQLRPTSDAAQVIADTFSEAFDRERHAQAVADTQRSPVMHGVSA